jgi:RNA polymerase sigma factor (sigma-70 family)
VSDAFRILMVRYRPWLLVETRQRCKDAARAEDYVSEAFTRLFAHFREELPPEAACVSWLRATIRNLTVMSWRREQTHERHAETLQSLGGSAALHGGAMFDGEVLPYHYPIKDIPEERFADALRQLNGNQAQAFRLWAEGHSSDEISRRLNVSSGAARKRIHDARQKLISILKGSFAMPEVN